ncbi:MAG: sigma-54-dependent Fis family transcriptional regulator, partial [Chromatiaceae bacterium]
RELAAVMERAAILGEGRRLAVAGALGGGASLQDLARAGAVADPSPARDTLDAAIRAQIESALTRCLGRIEGPFGAAQVLGINPHTLRARMRKLGIDWASFRDSRPPENPRR